MWSEQRLDRGRCCPERQVLDENGGRGTGTRPRESCDIHMVLAKKERERPYQQEMITRKLTSSKYRFVSASVCASARATFTAGSLEDGSRSADLATPRRSATLANAASACKTSQGRSAVCPSVRRRCAHVEIQCAPGKRLTRPLLASVEPSLFERVRSSTSVRPAGATNRCQDVEKPTLEGCAVERLPCCHGIRWSAESHEGEAFGLARGGVAWEMDLHQRRSEVSKLETPS